jgi:hypothetical protein
MFEEPVRYFIDIAQRNRSVLDLLHGTDTFVNRPLAKHYGMPQPPSAEWLRVENADRFGRGGILPMAVFQTKNAPGLRTSPVKRGYWVVSKVLGERIPPPPPAVPEHIAAGREPNVVSVVPKYNRKKIKAAPVSVPTAIPGQLTINSTPEGAEVRIDGPPVRELRGWTL